MGHNPHNSTLAKLLLCIEYTYGLRLGKVMIIKLVFCYLFNKHHCTARRKNLLAFACLFTFYACLFIFCACLFTFFLGANHKAPTFHVTLW